MSSIRLLEKLIFLEQFVYPSAIGPFLFFRELDAETHQRELWGSSPATWCIVDKIPKRSAVKKKTAVMVLASVNMLIIETMVLVVTTARWVKELSHMRGFNYTIKQSQTDRIDWCNDKQCPKSIKARAKGPENWRSCTVLYFLKSTLILKY